MGLNLTLLTLKPIPKVADELVFEFKQDSTIVFDEKNIRRRIYDALNVSQHVQLLAQSTSQWGRQRKRMSTYGSVN